jgi:hypothetical protein
VLRDPGLVADYVANLGDHYQQEVSLAWADVVEEVRREARCLIDQRGAFVTAGDVGALV